MSSIPTKEKLDSYVKLGLVRSQTHPTLPLTIYVYTETTTHERLWNNVTSLCRGLVLDDSGRCIVRCLPKFFNEDEPHAVCEAPIGVEPPVVFNKLDGSLIQIVNDKKYGLLITSKGSFTSDQAKWAQQIVNEKYSAEDFDQDKTYIFELIHPENRIVLDYGGDRNLYLLAVINTEGGQEYDIFSKRFEVFSKVEVIEDFKKHMAGELVEGVVVKTGTHRYKLKTGEYLRLHRIVTEFTVKRVWEALRDGDSLEFTNMPEEFETWLAETIAELKGAYNEILDAARQEFESVADKTDKEVGLSNDLKYKALVFTLRNGRDVEQSIWKMVKPRQEEITL